MTCIIKLFTEKLLPPDRKKVLDISKGYKGINLNPKKRSERVVEGWLG